jgi:hypothetical protein
MLCTKCGDDKPIDAMSAKARRSVKGKGLCKSCHNERLRIYRATDKGKKSVRKINLKASHGISLQEYREMLDRQHGVCAACKQLERGRNQYGPIPLAVDHDHETGQIRGLLCMSCNRTLGFLTDSSDRLSQLYVYRYTKRGKGTRPTCYIAGRMRGVIQSNFPAFFAAEQQLQAKGWNTINPARVDIILDKVDARFLEASLAEQVAEQSKPENARRYATRDTAMLLGLRPDLGDAIVLLDDWEQSIGANAEVAVARWVGLRILTLEEALKERFEEHGEAGHTISD